MRSARRCPRARTPRLAHQTPGFTGADLANIINEAALLAVRAGKDLIEQAELEEAVDRIALRTGQKEPHAHARGGMADRDPRIRPRDRREAIGNAAALQKVSVVARGRGRGGTAVYASEDKLLLTSSICAGT